tara:strand:+ start:67 stop:438 length:372 start_codon:yes stop_codon:yes gene_type:complete
LGIFYIAFGGAIGSLTRYLISIFLQNTKSGFPLSTFLVNVIGSFAIGIIFYILKDSNNENLKAFIIIGFLGGFTTFSAFSIDVLNLIIEKQYFTSMLYISMTFIFSLLAVFFGFLFVRLLLDS